MGRVRLRIFTEPQQGASYATLRRVASATEDLGFDAFFRSDHYLKMGDVSGEPGPTDAWATLAALAVETKRIKLGTLVTAATFRLPGPLAITVAQVDEMSGGRVELGLGTGWFDAEHAAYGIPFPPLGSASTGSRSSWRSSPACGRRRPARPSPMTGRTTSSPILRPCPSRCSAPRCR
jgi:alkanesulfonate monooxygenase SsuD/methylene tetrahydromethanopterin reductase-like flavin-dependent oxidoreductase (luciferase family)